MVGEESAASPVELLLQDFIVQIEKSTLFSIIIEKTSFTYLPINSQ